MKFKEAKLIKEKSNGSYCFRVASECGIISDLYINTSTLCCIDNKLELAPLGIDYGRPSRMVIRKIEIISGGNFGYCRLSNYLEQMIKEDTTKSL